MKKRNILLLIFLVFLCYPIYTAYQFLEVVSSNRGLEVVENQLISFQISIWLTWIVTVAMAVYLKWTEKNDLMFKITYAFVIVAFILFGIFSQTMVNNFDLSSRFTDNYSFGFFGALQNILASGILTGFLHAGVWWFTRRWHRR